MVGHFLLVLFPSILGKLDFRNIYMISVHNPKLKEWKTSGRGTAKRFCFGALVIWNKTTQHQQFIYKYRNYIEVNKQIVSVNVRGDV